MARSETVKFTIHLVTDAGSEHMIDPFTRNTVFYAKEDDDVRSVVKRTIDTVILHPGDRIELRIEERDVAGFVE